MSNGKQNDAQNDATNRSGGNSIWQNERARRLIIYVAVLLVVFLLGLVPMWMTAQAREEERDRAQAALRISTLQNTLANATIDARRGEYELARQAASQFFTNLRAEIDRGRDSVFDQAQRNGLSSVLALRDDAITLLARSDPASADQLVGIYNTYRQAAERTTPR